MLHGVPAIVMLLPFVFLYLFHLVKIYIFLGKKLYVLLLKGNVHCLVEFLAGTQTTVESQNGLGLKRPERPSSSKSLLWAGTPFH